MIIFVMNKGIFPSYTKFQMEISFKKYILTY